MPRLALRPLTVVAILALIAAVVGAQAPAPTPVDQATAQVVVHLLEQGHMAKPKIDDEIAKKWCKNFLKDLDPQKILLRKARRRRIHGPGHDARRQDQGRQPRLRHAGLRPLPQAVRRAARRPILELLKQKPDFTVDESIVDDPDTIDYPADAAEAKERWRKRIKLDLLQLKARQGRGRGGRQEAHRSATATGTGSSTSST